VDSLEHIGSVGMFAKNAELISGRTGEGSSRVLSLLTVCFVQTADDAVRMGIPLRVLVVLIGCTLTVSVNGQQPSIDAQTQTQAQSSTSTSLPSPNPNDGGWHFELSPYIWFAGTHGTVGALDRDVSAHASPSDLLSHFNFGLMGAAEARYNRFLLNGDMIWIRLSDSRALPFPALSATSADVRIGQFVWTSKVGYRVIENKKFKADANVGVRYWHLGQRLNFNPSILGLNLTASQSWADIVVGGRLQLPLGPKVSFDVLGDVGGWNATAKLDYQFAGLLSYRLGQKWTLSAGYRYLFVDYGTRTALYNMVTSGAVLGASYRFK
jgi:hypothetical protein